MTQKLTSKQLKDRMRAIRARLLPKRGRFIRPHIRRITRTDGNYEDIIVRGYVRMV